jgi:hypothetical protein
MGLVMTQNKKFWEHGLMCCIIKYVLAGSLQDSPSGTPQKQKDLVNFEVS